MSSGKPLLPSSGPSSVVHHCRSPQSLGSFRHLHKNVSSSITIIEESQENYLGSEESEEEGAVTTVRINQKLPEIFSSRAARKEFFSAEQFPLVHPAKDRRRLVSWGAMEVHNTSKTSSPFEISVASSVAEDKCFKSQQMQGKSVIFEENIQGEENPRLVYINDPRKTNDTYEFTGNEIRTSKYTLITFLPKNLFIQFHRVAYLYFLAIAALNQLPPLAVFGRTVSLVPLLFVLSVTAIKDGYEDWRRHRSDRNENNKETLVLQDGHFRMKKWKDIEAGEVVKIHADETIPCDMVLLGTSDVSGLAYIQTMNLDGESNLKTRYARQETTSSTFEDCSAFGLIRCEQPNRNIYEFTATMEFNGQRFPLSQSNIVLRGCQLKNTDWIVGVVVYAGQETKAMLNSAISPPKRSKLESYMNRETLWLSIFLFIMCLVVALGSCLWLKRNRDQLDTLPYYRKLDFNRGSNKTYKYYGIPLETLISFLSSIIVFQIMIPISLYITMELVRLGQSFFMIEDRHMIDNHTGSRFQCRSLNINEDLGQVRYVFSDKTGTLTENKMEFRRASVYGKDFGNSSHVADLVPEDNFPDVSANGELKSGVVVDTKLLELLHKESTGDERIAAHVFFLTLAACNTVIPIHELEKGSDAILYQGESPDEQALVSAACLYSYTLFERTSGHLVIDVKGEKLRLDVLGLHEFDSVRKRMSAVLRFPDNSVKVLVKGADSSMFSILAKDSEGNERIRQETQSHLTEYSSQGLRTLVLASKDLTDSELEQWQCRYEDASTSLIDRAAKLRQAASLIECNLNLLGATGIEDKLQDGVPEAIEALREAGIKVWVLTGDKQETAISIALSCKLLTIDMQQIIINGHSEEECRSLLTDAKEKYCLGPSGGINESIKSKKETKSYIDDTKPSSIKYSGQGEEKMPLMPLALVIDGNSLVYILEKNLESDLFDLATTCRVVLCCRVAPLQKAGIVDMIKSRTDDMTLAIGDGANDVSMIQMADVGVGICGQEGRQAVMASDFAMGQFRFLKRLLLVHGHWNYQRVAYLVLYNFYRNAVFVLMLFWYILSTAFSTTSALTDWSSVFYSVLYTSVPTIVVGVLDKDLSHRTLMKYPKLYGAGHRHEAYNLNLFWITMMDTLWQSLVLFYIPIFTYYEGTIDIWSIGSLWTIAVVILVNIHLAMDIQRWLLITHCAVWGSIVITYACMVVLDSIPAFPNYWTIFHLATSAKYWLTILLIIVVALLPRFLLKVVTQALFPSDIQVARESERVDKHGRYLWSKPKCETS